MTTMIAAFGYHDVTENPKASGFQRPAAWAYKLSPAAFAAHLDAIAAAGSAPEELEAASAGNGRESPSVLLTFDDGGKGALHVAEALARRGWPGHFFVVTGLLGSRTFLAPGELRELRALGHTVGSHSHTHPDIFRDLDRRQMLAEWRDSSHRLADLLGEPCLAAAVPGGDLSAEVLDAAAAAGFRYLFTSEPTPEPVCINGCWVVGRFIVKRSTPAARVAELARLRGWRRVRLARWARRIATASFPTLYRWYVASRTRPDDA